MKKSLISLILLAGFATASTPAPLPLETQRAKVNYEAVIAKSAEYKCYFESYQKNQGIAPKEFVHGLIANFTQEVCSPSGASVDTLGITTKDALSHYNSPARIENLYALMVGSGMQESSGGYNCGQDANAPTNRTGPRAEAGIFQTSYNSIASSKSTELEQLYRDAKAEKVECFSDIYIPCSGGYNSKNWGTGEGVKFQEFTKSCQGFATKYHSIMLRVNRTHYGPINTKAAEMMPSCVQMFSDLKQYISENKEICRTQQ